MGRKTNKQRRAQGEQSARARAAAMRLEQQRAARRRQTRTIGLSAVAVLAVVGVIVGVGLKGGGSGASGGLSTQVKNDIHNVSDATLTSVGTSGVDTGYTVGVPQKISDPPLTANGKPELLFIGAEFCPYCAAQRWGMTVALERFGSFSGLGQTRSGTSDGDIATLTYRNAKYTSQYLAFTPVEVQDRNGKSLENPTKAQSALWTKYTYQPPTSDTQGGNGYPFLDFGGKYVVTDPTFAFQDLSGLSQADIAKDLDNPSSSVGKAIDTDANYITAAICGMTNNQPASVCTASVQKTESTLPAYKKSSSGKNSTSGSSG